MESNASSSFENDNIIFAGSNFTRDKKTTYVGGKEKYTCSFFPCMVSVFRNTADGSIAYADAKITCNHEDIAVMIAGRDPSEFLKFGENIFLRVRKEGEFWRLRCVSHQGCENKINRSLSTDGKIHVAPIQNAKAHSGKHIPLEDFPPEILAELNEVGQIGSKSDGNVIAAKMDAGKCESKCSQLDDEYVLTVVEHPNADEVELSKSLNEFFITLQDAKPNSVILNQEEKVLGNIQLKGPGTTEEVKSERKSCSFEGCPFEATFVSLCEHKTPFCSICSIGKQLYCLEKNCSYSGEGLVKLYGLRGCQGKEK